MSDERQRADRLARYLDDPEARQGLLAPPEQEVVNALQQAATQAQPRAGFVNELAQQLRQKEKAMSESNAQRPQTFIRRLLAGALALVGLLLVVYIGATLFYQPEIEPAASDMETSLPSIVAQANSGHFAGTEFRVLPRLGGETHEVTLFQAQLQPGPETPQEARELAAALRIPNPHVYYNPAKPAQWIVMGDDGSSLSFNPAQPERTGFYYQAPLANPDDNLEPLSMDEAVAVAETFLENADLLPPAYEVSERPRAMAAGTRLLRFTPLLDGRPVGGHEATIDVDVDSDGVVRSARATSVHYVPLEETRIVVSEQDAFQELLDGPGNYSYSFETAFDGPGFQIFRPQAAQPPVGQPVTYTGMVNVLVGVESDSVRAIFHPLQTTVAYELSGPLVQELRDARYGTPVQISGAPGEAPEHGHPPLEVLSWEPAPEAQLIPTCLKGTASRAGEGTLMLESDDGETIELADGPEALQDGQRIEVCSANEDDSDVLSWLSITSPPASEINAGGSSGGVARSVEAVEAVEVTRVITEGAGGEGAPDGDASGASSGVEVARPVQVQAEDGTLASLELGERVTLTGTVQGAIFDNAQGLQVGLTVPQGDEPPEVVYEYVPLQGDPELLQEIARHHRLHVSASGVVVPANDSRMGDKAVEVQSYSRPYPEEQIETFLGHMEDAVVDGRDVVLFIDEESGQRYVVAHGVHQVEPERRMAVTGVVHPAWQVGELPVLQIHQQRGGVDVDAAESAADLPMLERSAPQVAPRGGPPIPGPLVVEKVTLGYSLDASSGTSAQILTPVWIFEGHTADGSQTFSIEIEVTE
ncbi:MAG TPA: hypothetical protein VK879_22160 [Candidatus Sulfomarinibacteraceae bacterium]|nr:hypothetical protein [Candidatus Sulfomarinibacteraceae bacterium]